jgi:hypothetical protein
MPRLRPRAVDPAGTDQTLTDITLDGAKKKRNGDSTYLQKVLAYIPIESVALYQVTVNQLGVTDPFFNAIVTLIWIATPLWMLYSTYKDSEPFAWDQAVTSIPAYVFWLAGLQSPFIIASMKDWGVTWKEGYGTYALIVGSMILPVIGTLVLRLVKWIKSPRQE